MSLLINITVHVGNHRCFSDPDPRLCCVCTQFNLLKLQNATNSEAIDSFFFQNVNCNTLVWLIKILKMLIFEFLNGAFSFVKGSNSNQQVAEETLIQRHFSFLPCEM